MISGSISRVIFLQSPQFRLSTRLMVISLFRFLAIHNLRHRQTPECRRIVNLVSSSVLKRKLNFCVTSALTAEQHSGLSS